jgi:chromosome segregation ATPase
MAKKSPARRNPPAKKKPVATKPRPRALPPNERLREAMEELEVARAELSRLGHAMTAANREREEQRLSAKSARDNLSAQLEAMRTDLKTALAELEIARADRERIAAGAQKRIHELEEKLAKVTAEVAELRKPAIGHQPSAISPTKAEPKAEG